MTPGIASGNRMSEDVSLPQEITEKSGGSRFQTERIILFL